MKTSLLAFTAAMLLTNGAHALLRVEGTVHAIDPHSGTFAIKEKSTGELHSVVVGDNTKIKIDRRVYTSVAALSVGDEVVYRKQAKEDAEKAVDYVEATIKHLDRDGRKVTVVEKATGLEQTLAYTAAAEHASGRYDISADDLRVGQTVMLRVEKR